METSVNSTNTSADHNPWNHHRLIGAKPPLKLKEIWVIRTQLQQAHKVRELALFNLAIDSKLRGCDLVRLRVQDITQGGKAAKRASIVQQKTKQPVRFEFTDPTREAVTVPLGQEFQIAVPRPMVYFLGARILMRVQQNSRHEYEPIVAAMPTGLYIPSMPQDRAIYIGTVRFFRDEFFDIVKIEVIDDYKQARTQFATQYGSAMALKKGLLRRPAFEIHEPDPSKRRQRDAPSGSSV